MAEKPPNGSAKHFPDPFAKGDYETLYWALVDFLTSGIPVEEGRRSSLTGMINRLTQHIRALERNSVDRAAIVRLRLLSVRPTQDMGSWVIYGEGVYDMDRSLLAVIQGTYGEAVERALGEPGFITEGMGGQIDPLGDLG